MGNHKRKRPKNRRAGCLMCKPWKMNGGKVDKHSDKRKHDDRADEEDTIDYRSNPYYPFLGPITFDEEDEE